MTQGSNLLFPLGGPHNVVSVALSCHIRIALKKHLLQVMLRLPATGILFNQHYHSWNFQLHLSDYTVLTERSLPALAAAMGRTRLRAQIQAQG